jgi:hypothetical protein
MKLDDKQNKEFNDVVRPVMKWISDNCHPHTHIVIDSINAELSEGVAAIHTEEYLHD